MLKPSDQEGSLRKAEGGKEACRVRDDCQEGGARAWPVWCSGAPR